MMNQKKNLLLIQPATKYQTKATNMSRPLALAYIAALTPDHWNVRIIDETVETVDTSLRPDLISISSYTASVNRAYELSSRFRSNNIPVVLGGLHVSMVPEEAEEFADSVVIGEAESVWSKVIADFEAGDLEKKYVGEPLPLNNLPLPRRELLPANPEVELLITSRGCPFNCEFCISTKFYGKHYRQRPVEDVIGEIETIKTRYLFFGDDNLFGVNKNRERSISLFKGMINRKFNKLWATYASINISEDDYVLKLASQAGCRIVYVGFESIDIENLKTMRKGVNAKLGVEGMKKAIKQFHKYGIAVIGGFILGSDNDDLSTFDKILDFINTSSIDIPDFSFLTPYPGTNLHKRKTRDASITYNNYPYDWDKYSEMDVPIKPKKITPSQLTRGLDYITRKRFSLYSVFIQFIRTLFSTRRLITALACLQENLLSRKFYNQSRNDVYESQGEWVPLKLLSVNDKPSQH